MSLNQEIPVGSADLLVTVACVENPYLHLCPQYYNIISVLICEVVLRYLYSSGINNTRIILIRLSN